MKRVFCYLLFLLLGWNREVSLSAEPHLRQGKVLAHSPDGRIRAREVLSGLKHPWSLTWFPDGETNVLLVSERNGGLWALRSGELYRIIGMPQDVLQRGQGGYLGLHYAYERIYMSYSKLLPSGENTVAVVSFTLENVALTRSYRVHSLQLHFIAEARSKRAYHFGGALTSDGNWLYLAVGERKQRDEAQNPENDQGSIVRISPAVQGSAQIFSTGHRNPQGLFYDKATKRLWSVEHGPEGGDELNLIESGRNYGWPTISYGTEYGTGKKIGGYARPGMEQPIRYWTPSPALSGLAVVQPGPGLTGALASWAGDLLIPALKFQRLYRVRLKGTPNLKQRIEEEAQTEVVEELFQGLLGRLRWVGQAPDASIYILTDKSNGQVLRLEG